MGSPRCRSSTTRQSSFFGSEQITSALWISQTPQECVGERGSTSVWEVTSPVSKPAHECLRWPCPAHLHLRWSRPAHLHLRWSRPAHLRLCWSRPAHLRLCWSRPAHLRLRWSCPAHLRWFRPVLRYPSAPRYPWAC